MNDNVKLPGEEEQDALFDVSGEDELEDDRHRLLVHFSTRADRQAFSTLIGQRLSSDVQAISYPVSVINRIVPEPMVDVQECAQPDLIEVQENWHAAWQGMPAYAHRDLTPWQTLAVYFKNDADRYSFAKLLGNTVTDDTKSMWFPAAEVDEVVGLRWRSTRPQNPKYPVYVPTKGRWESAYTIKCLERLGVPYYAVVQPQERLHYEPVVKTGKVLLLPEGLDGLVPTRNWIMEHSIQAGAERHWQFDDNIKSFFRYHENRQIHVADGTCMRIAEDFVDRYENIAIAGFQYFMFIPRKRGYFPPFVFNTRVYSNSLINNEIPYRYRDVYNDDTDICLRVLKAGWCTVQFNAFLAWKQPTMIVKGGNTPIYLGKEQAIKDWNAHVKACKVCETCADGYASSKSPCSEGLTILERDGRWRMAASLMRQHPDVTTIMRRWNRWQHYVDYRQFKSKVPRLRPGVVISEGVDAYGLELVRSEPVVRGKPQAPGQTAGPPTLAFIQGLAGQAVLELKQPVPEALQLGMGKVPGPERKPVLAGPGQPGLAPEQSPFQPEDLAGRPQPQLGPRDLKHDLEARGHRLLTCDGRFFVSEASRLTDDDRALIKKHREALIALAEPWIEALSRAASSPTLPAKAGEALTASAQNGVAPSRGDLGQSLFDEGRLTQTLAQFLGESPLAHMDINFKPDEPPDLTGIDEIVLNFATDGLDWANGARPIGVTVASLDGQLCRFLPFRFAGGNIDEAAVKRWAKEQMRGKKIINSKTKFDVHMAREWGVDLEEQGCTFSDIQHTAALLDDHRKRFALDVLTADYLPGERFAPRVDEARHHEYHASEVAAREKVTVHLVGRLRDVLYPELDEQELREVQKLEDAVIPAVVEMERNGSPLDVGLLEQYHAEANRRHDALLWEVAKECGFAFDHTAKGWQRLFKALGLPPTDGNSEALVTAIDHPTVKKAYLAAQYASLDSKTFKAYKERVGRDGILRFEINQLRGDDGGTVSGRFSIGYVQQVPNYDNHSAVFGEELFPRRLFVPASGDYLSADAMQIEQRLLVHYANNHEVIKQYDGDLGRLERGEDPVSFHKVTWAMMKRYKPDMLYAHQKSFNFAKQYGARSIKLAVMMGFITAEEGDEIRRAKRWDDPQLKVIKEIEAAYKKMMPEGDALLDRASHLAKPRCDEYCKPGDALHRQWPHRGYVKTLLGRRSRFPSNYKTYIGLNRVLQGTGADIMKAKLAELHRERKQTGFVMRMTVHDEVGGDATSSETKARVSRILNRQSFELKVPILWECKAGRSWAECK